MSNLHIVSVQDTEGSEPRSKETGAVWNLGGRAQSAHVLLFKGRIRMKNASTLGKINSDKMTKMSFPIKTCVACGEEFELKPDKPGFANRCPECSSEETEPEKDKRHLSAEE